MSAPTAPEGMRLVPRDEFFAALFADKRDIMPTTRDPDQTWWETKTRQVWGWSSPGWKTSGNPNTPKAYALSINPNPER